MNAWILIVLQIAAGAGGTATTWRYGVEMQEFHSLESCRAAWNTILKMDTSKSSAGNGIVAMECVKK